MIIVAGRCGVGLPAWKGGKRKKMIPSLIHEELEPHIDLRRQLLYVYKRVVVNRENDTK